MKKEKFTVTIAVNVPSYAEVEVLAESQEQAEEIVENALHEDSWQSPFFTDVPCWNDDWSGADELRVVPTA